MPFKMEQEGSPSVVSHATKGPQHVLQTENWHQTSNTPRSFLRGKHATRQPFQQSRPSQEQPIFISHGCLLIPVFLAAWWYHMKKSVGRVTGFLRNRPERDENETDNFNDKFFRFDDAYIEWKDILDETKEGTRTDRFVKWINRRNVRRRHAKQDIRSTTHRVLNSTQSGDNSSRHDKRLLSPDGSRNEGNSSVELISHQLSMQWECLSDAGDMDLCAMSGSVLEMEDTSIVSLGSLRHTISDAELMKARSMPTLAETLSQMTTEDDDTETPYGYAPAPGGGVT